VVRVAKRDAGVAPVSSIKSEDLTGAQEHRCRAKRFANVMVRMLFSDKRGLVEFGRDDCRQTFEASETGETERVNVPARYFATDSFPLLLKLLLDLARLCKCQKWMLLSGWKTSTLGDSQIRSHRLPVLAVSIGSAQDGLQTHP
jgi:hypothetical protein